MGVFLPTISHITESKCYFVVDLVVLLKKLPQEHSYIILCIYYDILVTIELISEWVYDWTFLVLFYQAHSLQVVFTAKN